MRQRDSQQSRVYSSEHVFTEVWSLRALTLSECQQFVDSVTATAWWKRRCPTLVVTVQTGARNGRAWAHHNRIETSPGSRTRWVMIHELAHILTACDDNDVAPHGPEFCANFVALARQFLSKQEGDALKASFRRARVKVRGAAPATRNIHQQCHCGARFIVGTGWRHPDISRRFCTKRCAQSWFNTKLYRGRRAA